MRLPQQAQPLSAALEVGLHGIELTAAQPYVADQLNVALTRGELFTDGRLDLSLPTGAMPRIRFEGRIGAGLAQRWTRQGRRLPALENLGFKALRVQYGGQESGSGIAPKRIH